MIGCASLDVCFTVVSETYTYRGNEHGLPKGCHIGVNTLAITIWLDAFEWRVFVMRGRHVDGLDVGVVSKFMVDDIHTNGWTW
jgi:hypothetical protein